MPRHLLPGVLAAAALFASTHSHALNILLTNDDGVSADVRAMQAALVAAGHDVIVSVPCQNQSGKGAAVNFMTPITPLTKACRGGAAAVGAPGVGAVSGLSNASYVDGTPLMATMYGLDVLAPQRWGKAPDLVVSGPNEGQNLGAIVISSGTVSNAQFAMTRGIPAVAFSADANTTDNDALAAEAAALATKVVNRLGSRRAGDVWLPAGYGLNVNFPKFTAGGSAARKWKVARFGNFNTYDVHFVTDLGVDATAVAYGLGAYHYPGVTLTPRTTADVSRRTDPASEALLDLQGYVTLTPMQTGYEAAPAMRDLLDAQLRRAFGH